MLYSIYKIISDIKKVERPNVKKCLWTFFAIYSVFAIIGTITVSQKLINYIDLGEGTIENCISYLPLEDGG